MDKHKHYTQQAIDLAIENVEKSGGEPFATIIVDENGAVVGTGVNNSHKKYDPTSHAEVEAIRDACENLQTSTLENCTLYTSCEPCPMCFGAIYWSKLKEVYFAADHHLAAAGGFDDTFIGRELQTAYTEREIPFYAVDNNEKNKPFEKYNLLK